MRKEMALFIEAMEFKLKLNDHKGGWEEVSIPHLLDKLRGEVQELEKAIKDEPGMNIMFEAADVANFAMMIAWNVMRDHFKEEPTTRQTVISYDYTGTQGEICLQCKSPITNCIC